jgi:putative membrane protein
MNALRLIPDFPRLNLFFIALWALTMVCLPVVGWVLGEAALLSGMSLGVLTQALAVLAILRSAWGWRRTLKALLIVAVLSYLAELLGSRTGFPFGKYHYTDLLQPQLAGVPLLIPLAWMMMLPPAWAIAATILRKPRYDTTLAGTQSKTYLYAFRFSILAALALAAWDLFLDPQMVGWGFWVWEIPGQYFGIPLVNYFGWILTSFVITLAANPKDLPLGPLVLVYTLTWLLQTIGQGLFWGQPGPALVGFLGCGLFVFLAWKARRGASNAAQTASDSRLPQTLNRP